MQKTFLHTWNVLLYYTVRNVWNYGYLFSGYEFLIIDKFKSLEHLDLSGNVITDRAKAFSFDKHNFPQLQTLTVKNNRLLVIENTIFKTLKHLQVRVI